MEAKCYPRAGDLLSSVAEKDRGETRQLTRGAGGFERILILLLFNYWGICKISKWCTQGTSKQYMTVRCLPGPPPLPLSRGNKPRVQVKGFYLGLYLGLGGG